MDEPVCHEKHERVKHAVLYLLGLASRRVNRYVETRGGEIDLCAREH